MRRRSFVKGAISVGLVAGTGLLGSNALWAADVTAASEADNLADVIKALGAEGAEMSDKVTLGAPDVAENGAVVPVSVDTDIEGVTGITFIAENNASPYTASYELGPDMLASVAMRIRMGKSGKIIGLVTAGDKIYMAERQVKVTAGGC